jgi:Relaxase/Mobilisation nuclease domain
MIPKASQRGLGQDLATHLQNAYDNEYVEIAEVRGAVAHDLHGAFAEWEVCAHAMTGCRNYLYSLSVNPDPAQAALTRAQYRDYIDRVEGKLGLSGQPRAVVFHIKDGREHCHVVWSRIDTERGKAVHQAFDRQKLMMVTRQFAREHGLALPGGMVPDAGRERGKKKSLSLYEKHQQDATGLTKEERIRQVTDAWRRSDSARAFVRGLEELGYVLATGKRPYVLVDLYGEMNALPKLIDDRAVRTKDIRAFLERDFPPESLPSIDEAKALVAQHRQAIEDFKKAQGRADRVDALKTSQAERRGALEAEQAAMQARHALERESLEARQRGERQALETASAAETKRLQGQRGGRRTTGLVAILARVSGFNVLRRQFEKHHDKRRQERLVEQLRALDEPQARARLELQRRHEAQSLDMHRRLRALAQVEARELKSLETEIVKEQRVKTRARGGGNRMPALTLDLKPPSRRDAAFKARNRHGSRAALEEAAKTPPETPNKTLSMREEFARAAGDDGADGSSGRTGGSSDGGKPTDPSKPDGPKRKRRRDRDRDIDLDR